MRWFIKNKELIVLSLLVFILRLLLSFLPSFSVDMGTWISWAGRLSSLGFAKFYSDSVWTQYTPGFLYWLWLMGKAGWFNELVVKIPVVFADIGVGILIWSLIAKESKKLAIISFLLYTLNPIVIFTGSVWGQIDGILTFFLFLSAYFVIEKKNLAISVLSWSIAFLIKPQAIAVAPVLLVLGLRNFKIKEILKASVVGLVTILLGALPFFTKNPILGFPQLVQRMSAFYSYTSVFAFNIWTIVGMWKADSQTFLGITYFTWGTVLLISSIGLSIYVFWKKLNIKSNSYLLFAILCLCFFLFPTRVHERYIFPFFAFLLVSGGLTKSKKLLGIFFVTSIFNLINLYHPYAYYTHNFLRSEGLLKFSEVLAPFIGISFLMIFFMLFIWEKLPDFDFSKRLMNLVQSIKTITKTQVKAQKEKFPQINLSSKALKCLLIFVILFSLVTRLFGLNSPRNEYFDEVYHAFTARQMLHGNKMAWEWWNTPPEGFAYEWTHPPLAKLFMWASMAILGENSFSWRLPGALLGVGCVYIIYLIAKTLFKDELLGIISAAFFSLDGLALTMSRIGMNDTYLLFFILLTVYLFIKEKNFLSALVFGLALSAKWSAVWAIPILFFIWLMKGRKIKLSHFWFLIIPPLVYLASYLPMFLRGHSLDIFWGMQKQMWWYHTGLKASHPYTSPWWSWPFLLRPVYLYTSDEVGGMVARIYNLGNPVVFWFGFVSILISFVYAFLEKNKNLAFVVFSYLVFFVPWAASPRIMFFYHYLPSIPFLAIATGYLLRKEMKLAIPVILLALIAFFYFYPHWAGIKIPLTLDQSYYWFSSWR